VAHCAPPDHLDSVRAFSSCAFSIFLRPEIAGDFRFLFRELIRRFNGFRGTVPPARGTSPTAVGFPAPIGRASPHRAPAAGRARAGRFPAGACGILPGVRSPLSLYWLGLYLATSWRQGSGYETSLISRAYAHRRRVRFPRPLSPGSPRVAGIELKARVMLTSGAVTQPARHHHAARRRTGGRGTPVRFSGVSQPVGALRRLASRRGIRYPKRSSPRRRIATPRIASDGAVAARCCAMPRSAAPPV
jgi:hypothetical protein